VAPTVRASARYPLAKDKAGSWESLKAILRFEWVRTRSVESATFGILIKTSLGTGSDFTLFSKPTIPDRIYGSHPVGWKLFLRIRPSKMDMNTHGMHGTMKTEITNQLYLDRHSAYSIK
jgi:hypothetical protein